MKLKILFLFLVIFYSFFNYTSLAHEPDNGGDYFTLHMQEILVELGCLDKATGVNDDQSVDAIKDFQKEAEIKVDGLIGKETHEKIMLKEVTCEDVDSTNSFSIESTTNESLEEKYIVVGENCSYTLVEVTENDSNYLSGMTLSKSLITRDEYNTWRCITTSSGDGQSRLGNISNTGFLSTFGLSGLDTDAAGVAIDSSDNIYITGTSQGTNLFGKNATSGTTDDIFVAKLNPSGVVQWVYTAGGTGRDRGRKIALDSSGNIYVTGYYWSTVDFGGGNVTSNGNWDAFLLKLDSSGTFQWVKSYGSNSGNDLGRDVAIDSNDNIYMLGTYRGTVDFGAGDVVATDADIFLIKFNSSGVFQWVYTAGGTGFDDSRALALDSNDNPYITGSYSNTVNFGGGNITAANTNDLFILKLNSSGTYQDIYTSNIDTTTKGKGLFVDSSGNIYATGTFQNTVNFGGGNITSSGMDIYLLKLNSSFAFQWVKRFASGNGASGQALGLAVTVDDDGNVYSGGQIGGSYNLGGQSVVSGSNNDVYIVKHDSSGTFQWSKTFGGSVGGDGTDKAQDIVIDSNDFIITVGQAKGSTDFSTVGGDTIDFGNDAHNWVLKIKPATGLID
tara:strand:+ start:126 stop:1970 length:1845 start_codon:yes stop_codon:yes gene_type:complete